MGNLGLGGKQQQSLRAQLERFLVQRAVGSIQLKSDLLQQLDDLTVGIDALRGWTLFCLAILDEGILRKNAPLLVIVSAINQKSDSSDFEPTTFLKRWQQRFSNGGSVQ